MIVGNLQQRPSGAGVFIAPQLAVPTAGDAISLINRWLHQEIGLAVHVTTATFAPESFFWHAPIELAYPHCGTLGVIGDVYVNAATGVFAGCPSAEELQQRAAALAAAHGITE